MREYHLEPEQIASSLFAFCPDDAYEIAIDFLNDALFGQDREQAVAWSAVLALVEKMLSDCEDEPGDIREMRYSSMM